MPRIIRNLFKHPYRGNVDSTKNRTVQPGPVLNEFIQAHNATAKDDDKVPELGCSPISFSHKVAAAAEEIISEGMFAKHLSKRSLREIKARTEQYKFVREKKRIKDELVGRFEILALTEDNWISEEIIKNKLSARNNERRTKQRKENGTLGQSAMARRFSSQRGRAGSRKGKLCRISQRTGIGSQHAIEQHREVSVEDGAAHEDEECGPEKTEDDTQSQKYSQNNTILDLHFKAGNQYHEDNEYTVEYLDAESEYDEDDGMQGAEAITFAEIGDLINDDGTFHLEDGGQENSRREDGIEAGEYGWDGRNARSDEDRENEDNITLKRSFHELCDEQKRKASKFSSRKLHNVKKRKASAVFEEMGAENTESVADEIAPPRKKPRQPRRSGRNRRS